MNPKTNEKQQLKKVSENYDLSSLINFVTIDIDHMKMVELLKEIEYSYFDYILTDMEQGFPANAGDQHFYLHSLIKALENIRLIE